MSDNLLFKRVLVANRGEIAVRIIRTLRNLGIESVAIYSEADAKSMHTFMADIAVPLIGRDSRETYLNIPKIVEILAEYGCDALHPGYGFLSENPHFCKQVSGVAKFIGPSWQPMKKLSDKVHAKQLMQESGVPTVPGSQGAVNCLQELEKIARDIGLPMILKAAHGGGGRGMRIVRSYGELADSFAACQREALAYFGNKEVFAEKYITSPRHIEFQIMCDQHGQGIHLLERDCSIQRRHQKLIEEAPSVYLSPENRDKLGSLAVKAAIKAGYEGAGTMEFICNSPQEIYFMEMNTRIQVEHCVTEAITGIDLIGEQIRVAAGKPLRWKQHEIKQHGWAVEARINAEDPANDFRPTPGTVSHCHFPAGPFVRVDTHLYTGYTIPSDYDSMIAKVIAWGPSRKEALKRLYSALLELRIDGVQTNALFHTKILNIEQFAQGNFTTHFLVEHETQLGQMQQDPGDKLTLLAAALLAQLQISRKPNTDDPSRRLWTEQNLREQTFQ